MASDPGDYTNRAYRKRFSAIRAIRKSVDFEVDVVGCAPMKGKAGDWLVIGERGDMRSCSDAVFREIYESIDE